MFSPAGAVACQCARCPLATTFPAVEISIPQPLTAGPAGQAEGVLIPNTAAWPNTPLLVLPPHDHTVSLARTPAGKASMIRQAAAVAQSAPLSLMSCVENNEFAYGQITATFTGSAADCPLVLNVCTITNAPAGRG